MRRPPAEISSAKQVSIPRTIGPSPATTRDLTHMIRGGEYTIEFLHEYINDVTSPHRAHHPSHIRGRFGRFHHLLNLREMFLETKGTLNNSCIIFISARIRLRKDYNLLRGGEMCDHVGWSRIRCVRSLIMHPMWTRFIFQLFKAPRCFLSPNDNWITNLRDGIKLQI